ncbi:MAG TPA: alpha/beta hydrolase [Chloroflexota bacterium]|nr:alpha/beta hydrolase [Chloroflexota bacterium]
MTEPLEHHFTASSPRLHYVAAGPSDGRPVILLHGFPDFWYGWRHQIPALAAAGLRVYALDQRGYNLSDKPRGARHYTLDQLAGDVLRVADEVAPGLSVTLVGHDFGAAAAWWLASRRPERVARQVIVNLPHPAVYGRTLWRNPAQLLRSWYILFFQLPALPEWAMRQRRCYALAEALRRSSRPGAFTLDDLRRYRAAWAQPGALTGMVDWYRGVFRQRDPFPDMRIVVPTLILWGVHDVALVPAMAEPSRALCVDGRLIVFSHCTHWPHLEEPRRVNDALVQFSVTERW